MLHNFGLSPLLLVADSGLRGKSKDASLRLHWVDLFFHLVDGRRKCWIGTATRRPSASWATSTFRTWRAPKATRPAWRAAAGTRATNPSSWRRRATAPTASGASTTSKRATSPSWSVARRVGEWNGLSLSLTKYKLEKCKVKSSYKRNSFMFQTGFLSVWNVTSKPINHSVNLNINRLGDLKLSEKIVLWLVRKTNIWMFQTSFHFYWWRNLHKLWKNPEINLIGT